MRDTLFICEFIKGTPPEKGIHEMMRDGKEEGARHEKTRTSIPSTGVPHLPPVVMSWTGHEKSSKAMPHNVVVKR
jgi:hypothetical protein